MSFLAPFLIRTLGPVLALAYASVLLAPMMRQQSKVYYFAMLDMMGRQKP